MKTILALLLSALACSAQVSVTGLASINGTAAFSATGGAATGDFAFVTNWAGYWDLDEASGSRADSSGNGETLTDNNSVGNATGKISLAGDFEYDSATFLNHIDDANLSLSTDSDFTIWAWVKMESKPAFDGGIVVKNGVGDHLNDEFKLWWVAGADRFAFLVGIGSDATIIQDSDTGAPVLGTWYLLIAWHDAAANTINLQINNGPVQPAGHTGGTFNGTASFQIGAHTFNSGFAFDGLIDEVGYAKQIFSASERTAIYNSGNGITK